MYILNFNKIIRRIYFLTKNENFNTREKIGNH